MKAKTWLFGWAATVLMLSGVIIGSVYTVDPFFHYHRPFTDKFYYQLDNQRYQNDGIMRHFKYNALITGTSMTENFRTSEFDRIFGVNSIKVPYSGAAYKEVDLGIERALEHNSELKTVVRGIDMGYLFTNKDWVRDDLGVYPDYLYDDDPFNDVNYVFNQDIIFNRAYRMILERKEYGFEPGIPTFDEYSYWQDMFAMGREEVCPGGVKTKKIANKVHMTDKEREQLRSNVEQNITSLPKRYPQVEFYYFLTPYSMVWWNDLNNDGMIYRYVEAEQYAIELMLKCENIKLFSFNTRIDITSDLNNYKDETHFAGWINTLILYWMHEGKGRITEDNYIRYIDDELQSHIDFDYASLNYQEDAADDKAYGQKVLDRERRNE